MPVVSVNEVGHGRSAGEDEKVRTNERTFIVALSSVVDDPVEARDAPGIPLVGSPHPADPTSFVTSKTTEETDNRMVYFVMVDYSSAAVDDPNFPGGGGGDPLDENPVIVWSTRDIEIVAEEGVKILEDGTDSKFSEAIRNSAGDLYTDPPLVIPDFIQMCTITRNERPGTDFNPDRVPLFANTINKSTVKIAGHRFSARTGWLIKYEGGAIQQRGGVNFVNVTYSILLSRPGRLWLDSILDQGLRERGVDADNNNIRINIKDETMKKITTPVNLDGKGKQLPVDGTPVFLQFLTKLESSFSSLNLPQNYSLTGS
jgi:hypothetical protein